MNLLLQLATIKAAADLGAAVVKIDTTGIYLNVPKESALTDTDYAQTFKDRTGCTLHINLI